MIRPATFQWSTDSIPIEYFKDFCSAYLDNTLIYSEDANEHVRDVKLVIDRVREADLHSDLKERESNASYTRLLEVKPYLKYRFGTCRDPRALPTKLSESVRSNIELLDEKQIIGIVKDKVISRHISRYIASRSYTHDMIVNGQAETEHQFADDSAITAGWGAPQAFIELAASILAIRAVE
ncbi:hypothetical protein VTL71DRAFT_2211 [Oculimacula yallundae]|uniref:Uncharacterized protein n=1 Tax=Oculimacula yallundae TaxID=86028 RepID=A0ABR4C8B6_9HELO